LGNCPKWEEDIPQDRTAEFRSILVGVQQLILAIASQRLIDLDDVLRWHATLFEQFVQHVLLHLASHRPEAN
jgi:hypothetical protein